MKYHRHFALAGIVAVIGASCSTPPLGPEPPNEAPVTREASSGPTALALPKPERVECGYPGDGYFPQPAGHKYLEDGPADIDWPEIVSGYDGSPLPVLVTNRRPQVPYACVRLLFNLTKDGQAIGIEIYDVQPKDPIVDEYYPKNAVFNLRKARFNKTIYDGREIAVDNNMILIEFFPPDQL